MRLKRLISCLLSAALLAGLLVFPPASASGSGGFSDISDSTVADAAEMLRLLGVVDGTGGGAFNPGGTCLLYTSPSPRDGATSRMPSSA